MEYSISIPKRQSDELKIGEIVKDFSTDVQGLVRWGNLLPYTLDFVCKELFIQLLGDIIKMQGRRVGKRV